MPAQRRKRRLSSVALALLLWLGVGLAAPVLVSLYSMDFEFHGSGVVAAPRDSYALTEPVWLSSSPGIRVERGTILLMDEGGSASSGEATEALLKSGAAHLVLDGATLTIAGRQTAVVSPAEPVAPLVEALASLHCESLTVRHGAVLVWLPSGQPETLSDVQAEVSFKKKGSVSAKGTGLLRGQRVSFDATAGTAVDRKAPQQRIPFKFVLKGRLIDIAFEGRLGLGETPRLAGQTEVSIDSLRQAARWLGAGWPSGPGLKQFSVKGQVDWTSQSLAFERSVFRMDGNEATGALELNLAGTNPAIVGTLALKTLDLSRYLHSSPRDTAEPAFSWSSLATSHLGMPLGMLLDADLRISADRVLASGVEFGRSAASISLRGGVLLTDIAELQFNGGFGTGQIAADFTGYRPKLSLRGKLEDVDFGRPTAALAGHSLVQGPATLITDLTASGETGSELLSSLTGTISIEAAANGRLGVDMKSLVAATQAKALEGWNLAAKGTTNFDQLKVRLSLHDGTVAIETAQLTAGDTAWTGAGSLNIPAAYLNLRIVSGSALSPSISLYEIARRPGLQFQGLLSSPLIKFSTEPDNTAVPAPFEPYSFPAISLPDRG